MQENREDVLKQLNDHEKRIQNLESLISSNSPTKKIKSQYKGPKGGILLLFDKGFFNTKKKAKEVQDALEEKNYIYQIQVIQTALNRLSSSEGILVKFKENGKIVYAKRK